jgi:hypothetical protein
MVTTGIGFYVPDVDSTRPLRIAVVLDRGAVTAWVQELLSSLEAARWADLHVVDADAAAPPSPPSGGFSYRLMEALDRRLIRHPSLDDAQRLVEVGSVGATRPEAHPDCIDVVVDVRPGPSRPVSDLAARGRNVWSIELGTPQDRPAGPSLFWAWFDQHPVAEVHVVQEEVATGRRTLVASSTVAMHDRSLTVSRSRAYWRAGDLVLRELARRAVLDTPKPVSEETSTVEPFVEPSSLPGLPVVLAIVARRLLRFARHVWQAPLRREQWILGVRRQGAGRALDERTGFDAIIPPPDREYADPFVVSAGTRQYLFIEEFPFATNKGHISVMELGHDGSVSEPRPVLERPYHLSYPFVFNDGADWYMIPETASRETVELYRAAAFPDEWEFVTELVSGVRALDTTLHADDNGCYWLFTSLERPGRNRNDELHLFSSDAITGPWRPHPANPVVADARFARPAGKLFVKDDCLIRPAQDCSTRYGAAIVFRRITRLDAQRYEEEMVATLGAEWHPGLVGTHTYGVDCGIEVVDGRRTKSRIGTYRSSLSRRLARARDQMQRSPQACVVASALVTMAEMGAV